MGSYKNNNYGDNDVAIVGLACRYPGEAHNPQAFLDMLKHGRDAWSKIPADRFDIDAYYHPSNERQGNIIAKGGYFLKEDISTFDSPFFSMTAAEANAMDPQQRLILESTYEAFESAGQPVHKLVGSETSVYIGCFTRDYEAICARQIDNTLLYQATGQGLAMLSNRLSWFYDLKGPSLTLDTACSSSLLALHLACQSIRTGESKMSIVGGVGLILLPDTMRVLTSLHFLSPDSKCYSFDDRANGYARGEGFATMILKPVADAIRDGDTIRAVIRATGSNQDGRTPGITLPSSEAQAKLIADTYRNAGLAFKDTQYFEAHGTGTPAGDPLELEALGTTFGLNSEARDQPLYVGSVKTNIGHLEGGAGLAGLMKAIHSVESGYIFPSLNYENPNPRLKLKEWNLKIPTTLTPWPTNSTRRVSVNSFGYGGSNVHVVIDDAYHYLADRGLRGFTNTVPNVPLLASIADSSTDKESGTDSGIGSDTSSQHGDESFTFDKYSAFHRKKLFVVSARDEAALGRMKTAYAKYVEEKRSTMKHAGEFLDSLAYTLGCRRSVFPWRSAVVGSSTKELVSVLETGQSVRAKKAPKIAYVFTGQGAQWHAMGRELMEHQVYAESVRQADTYLRSLGSFSVLEALYAAEETSRIHEPEYSQPLCSILQIALVDLLAHWGVTTSAVIGHSSGEIAAAYCIGALSAEDAWKVAYYRGQATKRIAEVSPELKGGMLAAGLSEVDAQKYLDETKTTGSAVIACINSPASVTISGDIDAINDLEQRLTTAGIFNRKLKIANAYHSPHMQCVAEEYRQAIASIRPQTIEPGCTFYSSVTGTSSDGSNLNADYWVNNMVSPVRFLQAAELLFPDPKANRRQRQKAAAVNTFIEIGPSGALQGPMRDIISTKENKEDITLLSMLTRGKDAIETTLTVIGKLWTMGHLDLDLEKVNNYSINHPQLFVLCDTPTYPWNHSTRYWHESQHSHNHRFPRAPRLDILGVPTEEWNPSQPMWRNRLRIAELPWIKEHQVLNSIIFPAAGYICAVIEAARQMADSAKVAKSFELRDVVVGRALEFDDDTDVVELVTSFKPRKLGLKGRDAPWVEWTIYSNGSKGHIEHCSGLLFTHYEYEASDIEGGKEAQYKLDKLTKEYHDILKQSDQEVTPAELYAVLEGIGLQYGPLFQGITSIKGGSPGAGCTEVTISDTKAVMPQEHEFDHLLHPCTLDACFQSIFVAFVGQKGQKVQAMVPTSIERISIAAVQPKGPGAKYHGFAKGAKRGFREAMGVFNMGNDDFTTSYIEVAGLSCTELGALTGGQASGQDANAALHKVQSYWQWEADPFMMTQDVARSAIMMSNEEFTENHELWMDVTTRLEKLSAIYVRRALKTLTPEAEAKLPPHLTLYVEWLRAQDKLAQDGALPLQLGSNDWVTMSQEEEEKFISQNLDFSIDAKIVNAFGNELKNILDGSVLALSVLMKDNMLFDIYANSLGMSVGADQWEKYFALYGHKKPDMKILEVGAGSGSITEPILKALCCHGGSTVRCSSYVFTDISSGFFEPAEKKLKQWANVLTYKRLDIESDPIAQGFEAESFDVITATNVLHATKNMNTTLQNCMKLLKPNGHLLIGEITYPKARLSLIYGTLQGWWLSEDGRKGGPCMSEEQWLDVFARNDLTHEYTVRDVPDEEIHLMSFFCATKKVKVELPFDKILLVDNGNATPDLNAFANNLKQELESWGVPTERKMVSEVAAIDITPEDNVLAKTAVISLLEAETPLLMNMDADKLKAVQHLLLKTASILWITKGDRLGECDPNFRLIDGLMRTVRNEDSNCGLYQLDFEKTLKLSSSEAYQSTFKHFKSIFEVEKAAAETEVCYMDGKFMVPRLYDDVPKNYDLQMLHTTRPPVMQPLKQSGRPLQMTIGVPGMLDTLHFIDDEKVLEPLLEDQVLVEIKSTAMNFVDIMVSMGIVPDNTLGCDASGVVVEIGPGVNNLAVGDRVAVLAMGAYRSFVRTHKTLPQKIPDELSFDDAATLLTVYVTAYQSLVEIGRLTKDESILIHAAAGGLGQAAIQLAQWIGAEVFVTVGSIAKKELVMSTYNIPEDHIFNSRDLTFADAVLRATNNKGVDVVLNSLAGEALRKTWTCIKDFGRFIEVGKKDILTNAGLEMMPFLRNVTFAGVNIEHIARNAFPMAAEVARKCMDLITAGKIRAVTPVTVFSMADMEKAFRTMQQGKHSGKIVLSMESPDIEVPVVPRDEHPLRLRSDATYLLVGGLGGLGRAQAMWLADNGAKYLAFMSRSGASAPAAQRTMSELAAKGVKSIAYACDCADRKALAAVIKKMEKELPPVYGVIQGAMVLSDSFFTNMKIENWTTTFRPKVQGSWNLHELLPKQMDFFIMLSSLAGVCGSRGQSNYAAGNSYQQGLAFYRRKLGLPATVLDLGIMQGFGFIEENKDTVAINNMATHLKCVAVEPEEFYSILKSSITGYTEGEARMPTQATIGAGTGGLTNAHKLRENYDFYWHDDVKFSYLRHVDTLDTASGTGEGDSEFRAAIATAGSLGEAIDIIQAAMVAKLAKAMMIPVEDIDVNKPISSFGVDSLVAVEVRNWISREIKSDLSVFDILSPIPMSQLIQKLALKSTLIPPELKAEAGEDVAAEGNVAGNEAAVAADDAAVVEVTQGAVPTNIPVSVSVEE